MTAKTLELGTALVAAIHTSRAIKCRVHGNHAPPGTHCQNCGIMSQADWDRRATKVQARHQYWCTETDVNCNYQEPHKHGVACDHNCNCKGE